MRKVANFVVGAVAVGLSANVGRAASIYNSNGFESPDYTLTGGYATVNPSPTGTGPSLYDQGASPYWGYFVGDIGQTTTSFAQIETTVTHNSSPQAVQFTRLSTDNDTYYAPYFSSYGSLSAIGSRYLDIAFSMNIAAGATSDPFFGIVASDGANNMAYAGVDATTGQVAYGASSSAPYPGEVLTTSSTVTTGTWHNYILQLDYNPTDTADQTATVFVDGVAVVTTGFIDGTDTGFTDADISSLATEADPLTGFGTGAGTAYFDDYNVYTSNTAVPEPASGTILLLAASATVLRRRRAN